MRTLTHSIRVMSAAAVAVAGLAACIPGSSTGVAPVATPATLPATTATAIDPLAGCPNFAPDTVWHRKISTLGVDSRSGAYKTALGGNATKLGVAISSQVYDGTRPGFPINVVDTSTGTVPMRPVHYYEYGAYSYNGLFPMPDTIRVESDPLPLDWWVARPSDDHVLGIDTKDCSFYELFKINTGVWASSREVWASSGARWNLDDGKTQGFGTNAAQLPYTGITMRLAEVQRGLVDHPIGACTNKAAPTFTWPARGSDGPNRDPNAPPMGTRFRLKADRVDRFAGQGKVVARAMTDYGVLLYDTCYSPFQITAENVASGWNDAELAPLKNLTMDDFDVVDQSAIKVADNTWATR